MKEQLSDQEKLHK